MNHDITVEKNVEEEKTEMIEGCSADELDKRVVQLQSDFPKLKTVCSEFSDNHFIDFFEKAMSVANWKADIDMMTSLFDLCSTRNDSNLQQIISKHQDSLLYTIPEHFVDFIIQNDLDVNIQDDVGSTFLMHLMESPKVTVDLVKKLLNAGIDISIKNEDGYSVLDWAFTNKVSKPILEVLLDWDVPIESKDIFDAIKMNFSKEIISKMISKGSCRPILRKFPVFFHKGFNLHEISPLYSSFLFNQNIELIRYLISVNFVHNFDLYPTSFLMDHLNDCVDSQLVLDEAKLFYCQPKRLHTLCFSIVSDLIGFDCERAKRLEKTGLPKPQQKHLMFRIR